MEFLKGLDVEEKRRSKAEVDRALVLGDEVEHAKALPQHWRTVQVRNPRRNPCPLPIPKLSLSLAGGFGRDGSR